MTYPCMTVNLAAMKNAIIHTAMLPPAAIQCHDYGAVHKYSAKLIILSISRFWKVDRGPFVIHI